MQYPTEDLSWVGLQKKFLSWTWVTSRRMAAGLCECTPIASGVCPEVLRVGGIGCSDYVLNKQVFRKLSSCYRQDSQDCFLFVAIFL